MARISPMKRVVAAGVSIAAIIACLAKCTSSGCPSRLGSYASCSQAGLQCPYECGGYCICDGTVFMCTDCGNGDGGPSDCPALPATAIEGMACDARAPSCYGDCFCGDAAVAGIVTCQREAWVCQSQYVPCVLDGSRAENDAAADGDASTDAFDR
jgi:hypothetical protein